jgi:hypothetical protein
LLEYIKSYNYIHPPGWEGVRELKSKWMCVYYNQVYSNVL